MRERKTMKIHWKNVIGQHRELNKKKEENTCVKKTKQQWIIKTISKSFVVNALKRIQTKKGKKENS